jgi:hypothetical protein
MKGLVIPGHGKAASPESIALTLRRMDCGLAACRGNPE